MQGYISAESLKIAGRIIEVPLPTLQINTSSSLLAYSLCKTWYKLSVSSILV